MIIDPPHWVNRHCPTYRLISILMGMMPQQFVAQAVARIINDI